jgi:hypothetical protein
MSRGRGVRRGIAQALADGHQPAMMVMAAPCAAAAIIVLFVPGGGTARSPARTAAKIPRLRPVGTAPADDNLIQEES